MVELSFLQAFLRAVFECDFSKKIPMLRMLGLVRTLTAGGVVTYGRRGSSCHVLTRCVYTQRLLPAFHSVTLSELQYDQNCHGQ